MPQPEGKVNSDHALADKVIKSLREAALVVKQMGDDDLEDARRITDLEGKVEVFERESADQEDAISQLADWRELIGDFGRDIIDKNELLRRTIHERER
jgi:hypothetical protein